jgi:4'-phosphopantetheinyl transferase
LHGAKRAISSGGYPPELGLSKVLAEPDSTAIEIERDVFEQPIVLSDGNRRWDVTIGHSGSLAVALAYPTGHPMGIDIERIDPASRGTISSQLSKQENKWLQVFVGQKLEISAVMLAAKEALWKALRTGPMSPVEIYNLAELGAIDSRVLEGAFENFAQYKARIWIGSSRGESFLRCCGLL